MKTQVGRGQSGLAWLAAACLGLGLLSPLCAQQLKLLATLKGHSRVESVAFSPDGKTLASAGDSTIKLWEVASGKNTATPTGQKELVGAVVVSRDGKTLASVSVDRTIKLWDVASGKNNSTLTGHKDRVVCVAFSPDGKTLASGSGDKTIKLWDVT